MSRIAKRRARAVPVLAVIPLAFLAASATGQDLLPDEIPTAESAFDAYLAERGEDLDACFADFPDLTDEGLGLSMRTGDSAAAPDPVEPRSVVLALDASGSMAGAVGGETKMNAALDAAEAFLSTLPEDVGIGLVVFGHRGNNQQDGRAESCAGVETLFAVTDSDRDGIAEALSGVAATGWTPLAAAIAEAASSFTPSEFAGEQVVYVISDGEETCDGDPVEAARSLAQSDIRAVVNIIGLDLPQADRAQLMAVAEAGNGVFFEAASGEDLRDHFTDAGMSIANAGALARTSIATSGGQARNTIATEGMLARASLCLGGASARETLGVSGWVRENDLDPGLGAEIGAQLSDRHARYLAFYEDLATKARARMDDANTVLQDDLDRAQEEFDSLDAD